MDVARMVLHALPDLKIIHNLRDPRGVVHSRKFVSESFHSAFAMQRHVRSQRRSSSAKLEKRTPEYYTTVDVAKEAKLLCRNLFSDIKKRRRLPSDQVKVIMYEEYASRPVRVTQQVYEFISQPMPNGVVKWLTENTSGKRVNTRAQTSRQANETVLKWQQDLSVSEMLLVNSQCDKVFQLTDHTWPLT
jgi:hypothetical protein